MANPTVGGSSERGRIHRYLADDHARLDSLLERATLRLGNIEESAYAEFRAGLLKHIAMEEKVLLPAAQRLSHGQPFTLRLNCVWIIALWPHFSCLRLPRQLLRLFAAFSVRTTPLKKAPAVSTTSAKNWQELKPARF